MVVGETHHFRKHPTWSIHEKLSWIQIPTPVIESLPPKKKNPTMRLSAIRISDLCNLRTPDLSETTLDLSEHRLPARVKSWDFWLICSMIIQHKYVYILYIYDTHMVWKDNSFNYDYDYFKGIYIETFIQIQNVTILGLILWSCSNVCSNECHVPGWDLYYSAQMMMVTKTSSLPSFREGLFGEFPPVGFQNHPGNIPTMFSSLCNHFFSSGGWKVKNNYRPHYFGPKNGAVNFPREEFSINAFESTR